MRASVFGMELVFPPPPSSAAAIVTALRILAGAVRAFLPQLTGGRRFNRAPAAEYRCCLALHHPAVGPFSIASIGAT